MINPNNQPRKSIYMKSDLLFSTLHPSELRHLAYAYMSKGDQNRLANLQAELCHDFSRESRALDLDIEKYFRSLDPRLPVNGRKSKLSPPRRATPAKSIFDLEKRAVEAMRLKRTSEILAIERLLALRSGPRARNLNNRITIYLWDQGMKPGLIPTA